MKKNYKRIISSMMIIVTIFSVVIPMSNNKVFASMDSTPSNYVLIPKEGKERSLENKYQNKIVKKGKADKAIVMNLTKQEANKIKNDNIVDAISEDVSVKAFSDESELLAGEEASSFDISNFDLNWSRQMVNATDSLNESGNNGYKVKIAIIDSGIDYSPDLPVSERKNFVPEESDDIDAIFDDCTGHGTSVAGIIASSGETTEIRGINPNVELYSAKIFGFDETSPISRVVDAIYWAIDREVDIINISFGTDMDSDVLEKAVQDAYNAGILIVAAAGNDGKVEYPAAYKEVIAVGSIDSNGQLAEGSASGEGVELVAPGVSIGTLGNFAATCITSGTSMAAPHVVGVASILLSREPSVSNDLIRKVLDASANSKDTFSDFGYGLVDLEYASDVFESVIKDYNEDLISTLTTENFADMYAIDKNVAPIETYDVSNYVKPNWSKAQHESYVINTAYGKVLKSASELLYNCVKAGARANDDYIPGMTDNPQFHGWAYHADGTTNNYIASYKFLIDIGKFIYDNTAEVSTMNISNYSYMSSTDFNIMKSKISRTQLNGTNWTTIFTDYSLGDVTQARLCAVLYGMALHNATDIFAHSSYIYVDNAWKHILHNEADLTTYIVNRNVSANEIANNIIKRYYSGTEASKQVGSVQDFVLGSYNGTFRLRHIATFAKAVDSSIYTINETYFTNMNNKSTD